MVIRKEFSFEAAHFVRNATSRRCSRSVHGHSFVVELFFTGDELDRGGMIWDFGIMKKTIKEFIDSFDHCWIYWRNESKETIEMIHKLSERWIELPVSPSAEQLSLLFLYVIDYIVKNYEFKNGECGVRIKSVRVHETKSGYAEATRLDIPDLVNFNLGEIAFSQQVQNEWSYNWWDHLMSGLTFIPDDPTCQIHVIEKG
jgi:6-pyruvoyltetrahydropterin/6-carboxytetrahydropterin synthase